MTKNQKGSSYIEALIEDLECEDISICVLEECVSAMREQAKALLICKETFDWYNKTHSFDNALIEAIQAVDTALGSCTKLHLGDLVKPYNPSELYVSGVMPYYEAVVVELNPLVLVSEDCSMRWEYAKEEQNKFYTSGKAGTQLFGKSLAYDTLRKFNLVE